MNQEERDIRLFEYWQGELLSPEEVREVESWLRRGRIVGISRICNESFCVSVG